MAHEMSSFCDKKMRTVAPAVLPGVSMGAITSALTRAQTAGLDWPAIEGLSESELEAALYGA